MRTLIGLTASIVLATVLGCSSAQPTATPEPTPTPAPTATPTPVPVLSETRPKGIPAWVPEELWNAPVLDLPFPPGVHEFTGWDGEGIFRLPEEVQPDSPAGERLAEGRLACETHSSVFPSYLDQGDEETLFIAMMDPHWIDFVSPTGYEYYECMYDVSKETLTWDLREGERPDPDESYQLRNVLVRELPTAPVRAYGILPDGPCQHPLPWEGFESRLVWGGAVLLPSGLIKVSCLYQSVPTGTEPERGDVG